MKRKSIIAVIIIFVLIAGIALTIFFLKGKSNDNTDDKVVLTATVREDGVVDLEIYNNGDARIDFGPGYELQIYEDGEWQLYPEENFFLAIGVFRNPGESYVEEVRLSDELVGKKCKIRVVKEIEGVKYYSNAFKVK